MTEGTFGERLEAARRKKGLSIEQVSDALRIRPSILEALETCSFNHMPLKGYSRNMVSSYARFVGLDSTELTEQFLREYYEFEKLQTRFKSTGNVPPGYNRYDSTPITHGDNGEREIINVSQRNKATRSYWATEDPASLNRSIDPNSYRSANTKHSSKKRAASRNMTARNKSYSNSASRGGLFSALGRHPVAFIFVLVIILLGLLVGWALLANSCSWYGTNPPEIGASVESPQNGVKGDDIDTNLENIQAQIVENERYGPFELRVEVIDGESWLEVIVDGKTEVYITCEAPWSQTFTIYSSCSIIAGKPSLVEVYRNDKEVAFDYSDGRGIVELRVEQKPIEDNGTSSTTVPNAQSGA